MQPQISFIIPVYNAEKYLYRCIKSIQRQTFKDFEIICVNDGSTDDSLKVLKKIQKTEPRMKIIDQKNGAMDSRKRGVIESVGQYIWFVDDDDEIYNPVACEKLLNIFDLEKDIQIIQFAIYSIRYKVFKCVNKVEFIGKYSSDELIHNYYTDYLGGENNKIITPSVWSKIYDAKVVKEAYQRLVDIPTGAGDLYLNLHIISSNEFHNIFCTNEVFYKYYSGIGSYSKADISFVINYSNIKKYQESLCDKYGLPERAKYYCHLESVYYLYGDVIDKYFKGVSDDELIKEIEEASQYECIRRANEYFKSRPKEELYEELIILTNSTPVEYLDYLKTHAKRPPNWIQRVIKRALNR